MECHKSKNSQVLCFLLGSVFILHIAACTAVLATDFSAQPVNTRPIVGILDQPSNYSFMPTAQRKIQASYVKFIEAAGARVAPIRFDLPHDELKSLFQRINGLLFPGGGADIKPGTQIYDQYQYLFNLSLEANRNGDYFPVIGICQGLELLEIMAADSNYSVLFTSYNASNLTIPLNFTTATKQGRMFGPNTPIEIYDAFATKPITFNAHSMGVKPSVMATNPALKQFFRILSTNEDLNGIPFVSSCEAYDYPVYGVQFHPSRDIFEWNPAEVMQHDFTAVLAMQYLANFFVNETRKNSHRFPSYTEELSALIYNYAPTYTGIVYPVFEQIYFFYDE